MTLEDVLKGIKKMLKGMLQVTDVHWINDRYKDYSTKSSCRISREESMSSRLHNIRPNMPIIEKRFILKCSKNKQKFNSLIFESIKEDVNFLNESTQNHKLIMMNESVIPYEIVKGKRWLRVDLGSSHEEANTIVVKHAIVCGKDDDANIQVMSDDTDVFALLCHHYQKGGLAWRPW